MKEAPRTTGVVACALWAFTLLWVSALTATATAGERWNVLVVGESSPDSMPLTHPAWRRVDEAISEQLTAAGFSIYDKAALGLALNCDSGACGNRPVSDYVRWAREQRGGIDLIVIYSITATERRRPATRQWQVRVPGRMVDVETAEIVDQWRGGGDEFNDEPGGCAEDCMRDWLGERLAQTGAGVGDVLAQKLGAYARQFTYQALAKELALSEFDRLEQALRSAPGYAGGHLKMLEVKDMHRQWLHTRATRSYEFRTSLGAGALNDLLNSVLADAGINATVRYQGREFAIAREGIPYIGRYASAAIALLLMLAAAVLTARYRRHELDLSRANSPRESLAYLDRFASTGLPWLPAWRRRAEVWRQQVSTVDAALDRARRCAADEDFEAAHLALADAKEIEPAHPEVKDLSERLPRQRRAVDLVGQARAQLTSEPAAAAHALAEAMSLDPARKRELQTLMDTLQGVLRRGTVRQAEQQAQDAMAQAQPYTALRAAGQGIAAIRGLDGMATELAVLRRLADQARAMIVPLRGPARGTGLLDRMLFVVGDSVEIGRGSAVDVGAVGVGYKRASRIGKQTRLQRDRLGLLIEDIGSTNGTQVDGQLLPANKPVRLQGEYDISLGGNRETGAAGACRFKLRVFPGEAASAALACDPAPLRLLDSAQLAEVWPSRREDLGNVWLALAGPVPLALGEALRPAHEGESAVIAVGYDEGYYVAPIDEASPSGVRIEGELITTRTPLSATAQLSIDGRPFGLAPW